MRVWSYVVICTLENIATRIADIIGDIVIRWNSLLYPARFQFEALQIWFEASTLFPSFSTNRFRWDYDKYSPFRSSPIASSSADLLVVFCMWNCEYETICVCVIVCVYVFCPHRVSIALMLRIADYFIFSTWNTNLFKFSLIFPFNHFVGCWSSWFCFFFAVVVSIIFLSPFLVFAVASLLLLLLVQPALYVC